MNRYLFINGQVITMEGEGLVYPACAVVGNKILGVGEVDDVKRLITDDYEEIDMKGGVLLPGFIDCHLHFVLASYFKMNLDLLGMGVSSLGQLLSIVKEKVDSYSSGKWILGLRMKEEDFLEKRLPLLEELDEIAPDHPVLLMRYDGHSGIANSLALKAAGINQDSPNPPGGEIGKKDGKLTGVLKERAMADVLNILPIPETEEFMEGCRRMKEALLSEGVVGFHNVLLTSGEGPSGALGAYEIPLLKMFEATLPFRHYPLISASSIEEAVRILETDFKAKKIDGIWQGGALKLFADGTFGSRTAYFYEEYCDLPGETGFLVCELDALKDTIFKAHEEGLRVAVHAIGDRAVDDIARIFLEAVQKYGHKPLNHRIEHCSMIQPDTIDVIKKAGVMCSVQPSFIVSEGSWIRDRVGDRVSNVYPMRTLLDQKIPLCGGSDAPIEVPEPLKGIWGAVVRDGFTEDQALTPYEALSLYTSRAAAASFEEEARGTITPGKLADLVILEKNPLTVPAAEIQEIKVQVTMIDGNIHYQK